MSLPLKEKLGILKESKKVFTKEMTYKASRAREFA